MEALIVQGLLKIYEALWTPGVYWFPVSKHFKQINFPPNIYLKAYQVDLATAKFLRLLPKEDTQGAFHENKRPACQPASIDQNPEELYKVYFQIQSFHLEQLRV